MPLTKPQIIPELLRVCPELQPAWDSHAADWAGEDPKDYDGEIPGSFNDAAAIVHAIVDFYGSGETQAFPRFFTYIERLLTDGDPDVQGIAVVGYLETLQTVASWREHGSEVFIVWMLPESRRSWLQIHQCWSGGKSLLDIAIDEATQKGGQNQDA
jgi:hypothetical protein